MLRLAAFLAVLLAAVPATAPNAQAVCTQRAEILARLGSQYSETPVAMGLASNGGMIEILTSTSGTTWTIILTMPDGMACLVAAGEGWATIPAPANTPRA